MTKTVIFDIDDTSANLKTRLEGIYRRATGDNSISWTHWSDYNAKDRYGITSDELGELFIEDNTLALIEPHEGIAEVTAALKERGYNIEFVTARAWCPNAYEITKDWLDRHGITYDGITIVPLFQCKEKSTRHIDNIELFIDDRLDHCQAMVNSGRVKKALLFAQPWNSNYAASRDRNIERISSLYEIINHITD